jgi:hypothetical protein
MRTFDAIAAVVTRERRAEPNIAMAMAAAFLDLGLQVHEVGPLCTALLQHMFFAHAVEGARQAPGVLQRLPDRCIDYAGRGARQSPRALAAFADDVDGHAAE